MSTQVAILVSLLSFEHKVFEWRGRKGSDQINTSMGVQKKRLPNVTENGWFRMENLVMTKCYPEQ